MFMFKSKYWLIPLLLIPIILTNCAKRGTITGGPKDTLAPVMTSSVPKNFETNFKGNSIKINFNEYIKIKDANKQVIVSPPLKNNLKIVPQGGASKDITISFSDTLQANTTYSINFGQSIVDNNEENPYTAFKYVFSTGDAIDSLQVKGGLSDALSNVTDKNVTVMLYPAETFTDSTIYKQTPYYLTNTLEYGSEFEIGNVKEGAYYLVAVKDENKNNIFDPNQDKIAFNPKPIQLPKDSLYTLTLFKEQLEYAVKRPVQLANNKVNFGVVASDYNDFKVETELNGEKSETRFTKIVDKDSIQLWLPKIDIKNDSIQINVSNKGIVKTQKLKLKSMKTADTLQINIPKSNSLNFRDSFKIQVNTPIEKFDATKVVLTKKDSTALAFTSSVKKLENQIVFDFEKEENQAYNLTVLPGAISDFYGFKNDTLQTTLTTKQYSDYGNLILSFTNPESFPFIIQLLDEKEKMVYEAYSENKLSFEFNAIDPKKYMVRVIYDTDKNKEWTTGSYLEKRQPEKVFYFPALLDVRANWDVNQTINLAE